MNKEEYIQPIVNRFPIFREHPYLFPLLIVAVIFVITTLLVIFLCKETLPKAERLSSHSKDLAKLENQYQDLNNPLLDKPLFKKPSVFSLLMERNTFLLVTSYSTPLIFSFTTSISESIIFIICYSVFCCCN